MTPYNFMNSVKIKIAKVFMSDDGISGSETKVNEPLELAKNTTKSALWVAGSQVVKAISTLIVTIVAARILSPSDFGIIGMMTPVTVLVLQIQDLGLSQAIIQNRYLTAAQVNALFYVNLLVSASLLIILLLAAYPISLFYREPNVFALTCASALTVFITGLGVQQSAIMSRDMRFRSLAMIESSAAIVLFSVTVVAALILRSYWAFFWGTFLQASVQTGLLWRISGWHPMRFSGFRGVRQAVTFGTGVASTNFLNYLIRNADNILLARFTTPYTLGLYDQSYKLMMAPLQAIMPPLGRVMLPTLARMRDDDRQYRAAYLTSVRATLLIVTPGLAVLAAMSGPIMVFLLGERWAPAAPIFYWLTLTGLIQPIAVSTGWLYLSSGRSGAMFQYGVFSAVITLTGFAIGLHWGAVGIAASLFITAAGRLPVLFVWCTIGTSVTAFDHYRVAIEPVCAALVAFLIAPLFVGHMPMLVAVTAMLAICYAVALAAFMLSADGRRFLIHGRSMIPLRFARGAGK